MTPPEPVEARDLTAEDVARLFHTTYERRAPSFGYRTRAQSAVPWEDVPAANRALMVAVAGDVLAALRADTARVPEGLDVERLAAAIDRWWNVDPETGERHGHPYPTISIIPSMVGRSVAREYAALATSPEGGSDD